MKTALLVCCLVCITSSLLAQQYCNTERFGPNAYFDTAQIQVDMDIIYDVTNLLTLDLFYPKPAADNISRRPLIILMHGGFYLTGSSKDWYYNAYQLAQSGYVVAAINTRKGLLYPCGPTQDIPIPLFGFSDAAYKAVQDAIKAGHYLSSVSLLYGINTSQVFYGGYSTGAYTALSTELLSQGEADRVEGLNTVLLGPIDPLPLLFPFNIKGIDAISGGISRSHLNKLEKTTAILFHGQLDFIIPYKYSPVLDAVCGQGENTLYPVYGSSRIYSAFSGKAKAMQLYGLLKETHYASPSQPDFYRMTKKIACFNKEVLCNVAETKKTENLVNIPVGCSLPESLKADETATQMNKIRATIPARYRNLIKESALYDNDKAGYEKLMNMLNTIKQAPTHVANNSSLFITHATRNAISFTYTSPRTARLQVSLIRSDGSLVSSTKMNFVKGDNTAVLQVMIAQPGVYLLKLSDGATCKIMIR